MTSVVFNKPYSFRSLGQASAVPPNAPLVSTQDLPQAPMVPLVSPRVVSTPAQDYYEAKPGLSVAALVIGGIVLTGIVLSVTGAFSRRR